MNMDSTDSLKRQLSIAYLKSLDVYAEDLENWKTAELLAFAAFAEAIIFKQKARLEQAKPVVLKRT